MMIETIPDQDLLLRGIENGRKAFSGPHTVQIDLTDRCNNNCIGCWIHSPFVAEDRPGHRQLPFGLVESLINRLHTMGTKEIFLSGSGEPFMYPEIERVVKLIKSKGIWLNIITNAFFMNDPRCEMLISSGVDLITASVWAGSAEAYIATHPGKNEDDFNRVRENLKLLASYKRRHNSILPHVKVYNVISSRNYYDLKNMISFAKSVDTDSIEFQAVDIIKGKTDFLALDGSMIEDVRNQIAGIKDMKDAVAYRLPATFDMDRVRGAEFADPAKIWKNHKEGFTLTRMAEKLVCPRGCELTRDAVPEIEKQGITNMHVMKYEFLAGDGCGSCKLSKDCFEGREYETITVELLNLLSTGTLLRRLSDSRESSCSDTKADSIPCYIGWYYCRILTDGSVIPCCKAADFPLGNIYKDPFGKIWDSRKYRKFRFNAKHLSKSDPYFSRIGCLKSCDNWGMNLNIHNAHKGALKDSFFDSAGLKTPFIKDSAWIEIMAKDYVAGDLNNSPNEFGKGIVIDSGEVRGRAEYNFNVSKDGIYRFYSRYASRDPRPVRIFVDVEKVSDSALSSLTGGWTAADLKWFKESEHRLNAGQHKLRLECDTHIPHIEKFVFTTKDADLHLRIDKKYWNRTLSDLKKRFLKRSSRPAPGKFSLKPWIRYKRDRFKEVLGIYDGCYAYKGPFHVQIDLTNNCNNNCIACWCNSPLLGAKRLADEEKEKFLPLRLVKELLDEAAEMGATEVYYSGSGEPFTHPDIMEILKYTKSKKLICHVNTNFTLLNAERIKRLIAIRVDFLTVSTWAATGRTYARTHPGKTEADFEKIRKNLISLNRIKQRTPCIKLYNVIFSMNYHELEDMVDFAIETNSESLEFTLVDTIPGATDKLALSADQLGELNQMCRNINSRLDGKNRVKGTNTLIFQFEQFLRRISVSQDAEEAKYDRNVIDSMPCYIGWLFTRVTPNGEIHPCLKAHRIPSGSLYRNSFREIWNSKEQAAFRKKTNVCEKRDPFFRLIGNDPGTHEAGCYKSCDDIGRNSWMHRGLQRLNAAQRMSLKAVARVMSLLRKLKSGKEDDLLCNVDRTAAGISHGRKAFTGPEQVVIDPTNRCNLRCVSCWLYSPMLENDKPSGDWLKKELPGRTMVRLIDDLAEIGTKRIRFTGGGEPFMHRDLMEVIEYAGKKKLSTAITTNLTLVSRHDIKRLLDAGLEELCVSIWASTPENYARVHPGVPNGYFERVKDNLLFLKKSRSRRPKITFANVIMNNNVDDLEGMYEFGLQYGADALYFTVADVFDGQTDRLLLSEDDRKGLVSKAEVLKKRAEDDGICLQYFDGFIRRLSNAPADFSKGEYDRSFINRIPCYIGWLFSRILADGTVAPCCRGVKKATGNINRTSFKDIWFSREYDEFRSKAKFMSKDTRFFRDIGCVKECDNLMHNEEMHNRIIMKHDNKTEEKEVMKIQES